MTRVLLIGSAPNSIIAREWDRKNFDKISAINNAWQVRDDWNDLIYPHDLLPERLPKKIKKVSNLLMKNSLYLLKINMVDLFMLVGQWHSRQHTGYYIITNLNKSHLWDAI